MINQRLELYSLILSSIPIGFLQHHFIIGFLYTLLLVARAFISHSTDPTEHVSLCRIIPFPWNPLEAQRIPPIVNFTITTYLYSSFINNQDPPTVSYEKLDNRPGST